MRWNIALTATLAGLTGVLFLFTWPLSINVATIIVLWLGAPQPYPASVFAIAALLTLMAAVVIIIVWRMRWLRAHNQNAVQ